MNRVMGWFETKMDADLAVDDLLRNGFSRELIHIGHGMEFTRGTEAPPQESGGLRGFLKDIGLISDEPAGHAGKIRDEDVLVAVDCTDERVDEAAAILNRRGAIDIEERGMHAAAAAPAAGAPQHTAPMGTGAPVPPAATHREHEKTVPVIEEELKTGKREVRQRGARVFTRRTERPVEEEIRLRQEKAYVERRPVDRPAGPADLAAFKEGSMEITESSEEPVVSKQARVKEEVTIGKESTERTEKIRETLHGTEVEVEALTPEEEAEFSALEPELRSGGTFGGRSYDELRPLYRYGYHKGRTSRADWGSSEPDLRRDWESHHAVPWEQSKAAIRAGWERAHHHR